MIPGETLIFIACWEAKEAVFQCSSGSNSVDALTSEEQRWQAKSITFPPSKTSLCLPLEGIGH